MFHGHATRVHLYLGVAEVADLEQRRVAMQQDVLQLEVPVAHPLHVQPGLGLRKLHQQDTLHVISRTHYMSTARPTCEWQ